MELNLDSENREITHEAIYHLYNLNSDEYFFTINHDEKDTVDS